MTQDVYRIFDQENRYVTSYLFSSKVLGSIRLVFGVYFTVTALVVLIWSGVVLHTAQRFFSFFTDLTYTGIIGWLWASGVQTIAYSRSCGKTGGHGRYPLQSWPRVFQVLHEMLLATVVTFPFVVTIVFWSILAPFENFAEPYILWSDISQHLMNSVFALFEIIFTDLPPLRWIHLPVTIFILGLYLSLAYLTHATQGFYVYPFLDPQREGARLALYIIGIPVGQAIVFVIVRYAIVLRVYLVNKRNTRLQREAEWEKEILLHIQSLRERV